MKTQGNPLDKFALESGVLMNIISINELMVQAKEEMQKLGYSPYTIRNECEIALAPIVRYHEQFGKENFDTDVIDEYVKGVEKNATCGEIGRYRYLLLKRGVARLTVLHDTGKLEWIRPLRASKFKLNKYYDEILTEYLSCETITPGTQKSAFWVARKYFAWLIQMGNYDFSNVGCNEIQQFMIYCSNHIDEGSLCIVKRHMKKICRYLAKSGRSANSHASLLSFPVYVKQKILPAIPQEEVNDTLDVIDRSSSKGKRDYAIILLSTVTGLRGIDIRKLKLKDIDWKNGEIRIVQSKTSKSLALPLTKDVGEAIRDYILNGRPKCDSKTIFLSCYAPYQALSRSIAGYFYNTYRKEAGLSHEPFDGKSFHALRRSVGRNMITSGIPVTTVAQVLGHGNINSTKKYISLDSKHLKECALDFTDIELTRREA
ncbi:MAG: tyrosine-type recombinase/integrase [Thermoplasmata archaeon]|nr:tyrosine-type recombinase/integrase [Thermoplasmata archaeon]